jgi:hypothetical protein
MVGLPFFVFAGREKPVPAPSPACSAVPEIGLRMACPADRSVIAQLCRIVDRRTGCQYSLLMKDHTDIIAPMVFSYVSFVPFVAILPRYKKGDSLP